MGTGVKEGGIGGGVAGHREFAVWGLQRFKVDCQIDAIDKDVASVISLKGPPIEVSAISHLTILSSGTPGRQPHRIHSDQERQ